MDIIEKVVRVTNDLFDHPRPAIYLPSFLLLIGALPFWGRIASSHGGAVGAQGINATVVGILLGAPYAPVWECNFFPGGFGARRSRLPAFVILGAFGATAIAVANWAFQ